LIGSLDAALVSDATAAIARHAVSERIFRSLRLFMRIGYPGIRGVFARMILVSKRYASGDSRAATTAAGSLFLTNLWRLIGVWSCGNLDSFAINVLF
jgi:hypothetical protein